AKILAKSPNFEGIKILVEVLENEKDPMVLQDLIAALENSRYDIVFEAMKKYLKREDKLYWASNKALGVIGSQRSKEAFNFLKNYKNDDDYKSIVRSGQIKGIGNTRSEEAIDYLLELLPYGKETERIRHLIVNSLGEATKWAEKRIKDKVIDYLSDLLKTESNERVIGSLVRTLTGFKETKVISTVEEAKYKIATQAHPSIDRGIKSITKGKSSEEEKAELQKDIDEMKKKMKELFAKVEILEAKIKKE
ncbi:MAG: hypothetical protein ACTSWX_08405, partial [Promethearchaeota archaeon]